MFSCIKTMLHGAISNSEFSWNGRNSCGLHRISISLDPDLKFVYFLLFHELAVKHGLAIINGRVDKLVQYFYRV